ncbi:MAG: TadE/TadG family type IV pilus assembly protein [Lapillicoccus sp.]
MPPPRRDALRRDHGNAVAEFVLVSGLVLVLGIGVFQLGLALYVRNTLISCASEGARLGARADSSPTEGAARSRDLISRSLSPAYAGGVVATTTTTTAGVRVVDVTVSAPVPVIGLLGPSGVMTVQGRAFLETQ